MKSLNDLIPLDEERIVILQNSFLEAKAIRFRELHPGGGHPISKTLVSRLNDELTKEDPKVNELVRILEQDPVNAVRLIGLAHSPAYMRPLLSPNLTSVIQQFGFKRLKVLLAEIGEAESYATFFQGRTTALEAMQRSILAATLAKKLARSLKAPPQIAEEAYIVSAAAGFFRYALAYCQPSLTASWLLDGSKSGQPLDKSTQKLFFDPYGEINFALLQKLSLPVTFLSLVGENEVAPWNKRAWTKQEHERLHNTCYSVYVADEIIDELLKYGFESKFYTFIESISEKIGISYDELINLTAELVIEIKESEELLGLKFPELPGFLQRLSKKHETVTAAAPAAPDNRPVLYKMYFAEIKESLRQFCETGEDRFLTLAITTTLSALVRVLRFERAALIVKHEKENALKTMMIFGRDSEDLQNFRAPLAAGNKQGNAVVQTYIEKKITFRGPISEEAWPLAAFPLCIKGKTMGVFYADTASKNKADDLSTADQMILINLAELFLTL